MVGSFQGFMNHYDIFFMWPEVQWIYDNECGMHFVCVSLTYRKVYAYGRISHN